MESPFLRPYDPRLAEIVTDAAVHILGGQGVDRFSIRGIARWMRVTPAYLLNDFSRARLVEIIAITFGDRWIDWCAGETTPGTAGFRLPETPDECLGVRVWSALEQLAEAEWLRDNPAPTFQIGCAVEQEAELLALRLRMSAPECCPPVDAEVSGVQALLGGLRVQLARRERPMELTTAQTVLGGATCGLLRHHLGCSAVAAAS